MSAAKAPRFGASVQTGEVKQPRRSRRHPLTGNGPIVDRARAALARTAAQFGEVTGTDQTFATARTHDGITLTFSYDPGNYVFSRVYNLTITATLPATSAAPARIELSHRDRRGPRFVGVRGTGPSTESLVGINGALGERLRSIDLVSARIEGSGSRADSGAGSRTVTLTPMGGSYVWVLIPPVFKATAFPAGEPERIVDLVRALRDWAPVAA